MRRLATKNLKQGMVLAKPIYSTTGGLIMPAGIPLTTEYIERISANGISEVYLDDPRVRDIQIIEPITEITKLKAIRALKDSYALIRRDGSKAKLNDKLLLGIAQDILADVLGRQQSIVNLIEVKSSTDFMPVHAINVTILSIVIAKLAGYSTNLKDVAVGAFLKDIGMALLPDSLLSKPEQFTDEERAQMQKHTELGLQLVGSMPGLSAFAKVIISQHHERMDGSGYPLKLSNDKIHQFSRVVAIADTYAALIADRPHRLRVMPHEAIEYIMSAAGFDFDHTLVDYFCRCTVPYSVGTMVELSSGEKGVVVEVGKSLASRPRIRVFYDEKGQTVAFQQDIDLSDSENQTKLITKVLDE